MSTLAMNTDQGDRNVAPCSAIDWANLIHLRRMAWLIEVQFGGANPRCEIVDRATNRAIAERTARDYRVSLADSPDFLGCFVREEGKDG